jgi:4-hydroxyproline epimerase
VVANGGPELVGSNMIEKRQYFLDNFDWVRTGLMFEPRGHDVMSGSILYPSTRPDCDAAILFIEISGCLPMCGHGTIGTVNVAIEHGLVIPQTAGILCLDTPAGVVEAFYTMEGEFVANVRIRNIASYLHATNLEVNVPGLGRL